MSISATCPEWCTNHVDETARGDGFTHQHHWSLGTLPILALDEVHSQDGDLIERNLSIIEAAEMLTVAEARELSALLLKVADYLEALGLDSETHDPVRLREMSA